MKMGQEQTLWRKYGKSFLMALVAFLLAYGGFQYYAYYQNKKTLEASAAYDRMLAAMQKQDKEQIISEAKVLIERFVKTPYSSLAALLLAKLAIEENNLVAAKEHLQFALKNAYDPVQQVAKIRMARVLADEKNYEAALTLLDKETPSEAYKTLVEEAKGDIYLMQNEKEKARQAYQAAITAAPPGVPTTRLQLKYADLGGKEGA